jgi:cAMP and cAMP-inhibited cGMP 3',5'-cyclic phosphodiesterase 10
MDAVIKKVMKFAQKLVDADRASLFLLDAKTKELYARIFDLEWEGGVQNDGENNQAAMVKEIRYELLETSTRVLPQSI